MKRRLKRSVRRTIAALLMVSALIVAAVPADYISAQEDGYEDEVYEEGFEDEWAVGADSVDYEKDGIIFHFTDGVLTGYEAQDGNTDGISELTIPRSEEHTSELQSPA